MFFSFMNTIHSLRLNLNSVERVLTVFYSGQELQWKIYDNLLSLEEVDIF